MRTVCKRLIEPVSKARNQIQRMPRFDIKLGVVGVQVRSDTRGIARLVVARGVKPDRKRLHRARTLRLHQCNHSRGIDAARKKRSEWHICDHSQLYGIAKKSIELLDRFGLVGRRIVALLSCNRNSAGVPEAFQFRRLSGPKSQNMTGWQLHGFAINCARLGDIAMAQRAHDRVFVDCRPPIWYRTERLQLRSK